MAGASQASPKRTQTSSSGAGACASDEYLDSKGVCMCNEVGARVDTIHCEGPEGMGVWVRFRQTLASKESIQVQVVSSQRTERWASVQGCYNTVNTPVGL